MSTRSRRIVPRKVGNAPERTHSREAADRCRSLSDGQMTQTSSREIISTRKRRLAVWASEAPERVLTTLAHHIDLMWLEEAYRRTLKDGAVEV